MAFEIRVDDLSDRGIAAVRRRQLEHAATPSPRESIHALDLDRLRAPGITFWGVGSQGSLMGGGERRTCASASCGAPRSPAIATIRTVCA